MAGTLKRIATLVHVSDLHIGDVTYDLSAPLDAATLSWWRLLDRFDGYLGHGHEALKHVQDRFGDLVRSEDARLVFTGDLTARGAEMQFLIGRTYLEGRLVFDAGVAIGLDETDALERSIPGNHDRWPGCAFPFRASSIFQVILGSPTPAHDAMFGSLPHITTVTLPPARGGDARRIVMLKVNSEADVHPSRLDRLLARGDFISHLDQLRAQLTAHDPEEIRVLLVHHTRLARGTGRPEKICAGSLHALERFIEDHDIAIVLTGHIHEPLGGHFTVRRAGRTWEQLEICAGTTTQRDTPPASWNLSPAEQARFRFNSLCVHRLHEDLVGDIYWESTFEIRGRRGFVPVAQPAMPRIKVWPR